MFGAKREGGVSKKLEEVRNFCSKRFDMTVRRVGVQNLQSKCARKKPNSFVRILFGHELEIESRLEAANDSPEFTSWPCVRELTLERLTQLFERAVTIEVWAREFGGCNEDAINDRRVLTHQLRFTTSQLGRLLEKDLLELE